MIHLDDDELYVEEEPTSRFVTATRSLGRKQSAVRWLPECAAGSGVVAAGTWDDPENTLSLWSVQLERDEEEMDGMDETLLEPTTRMISSVSHPGCVLGLAAGGGRTGDAPVVLTAGGDGALSCFSASALGSGSAELELRREWSLAAGGGEALLGVDTSADACSVACVGERANLAIHDTEGGAERARAQSEESCLFSVQWVSPHQLLTAGAHVLLWDVRAKPKPVVSFIPRFGAAMHAAPQLLSAASHPHQPHRLAAGATDGSIYLWDMRAAAPLALGLSAHTGDVWHVGFSGARHGELLSCSSDGTLTARDPAADPATVMTLLALEMPINDFDVSAVHGGLAAASDSEVLTFIDVRSA
jgi:WD40 repeat protein